MTRESDAYEIFTQHVMSELTGEGVEVFHQREFTGKKSNQKVIVDVSFNQTVAGGANILVLVECKHYSNTVEIGDIREFQTVIDDVGARKGIMITTVGYQSGVYNIAQGYEISLALLTKEMQPNENQYLYAEAGDENAFVPILQGNLRGVMGNYEGGYRFHDAKRLINLVHEDSRGKDQTKSGT